MATRTLTLRGALFLSVVCAAVTPLSDAHATLLTFDDVVAPCGFSDTQALRNEYVGLGVSFSAPGNDGGARLDDCSVMAVNGYSPPNFLAFNAEAFYLNGGTPRTPETLTFAVPMDGVRFKAGSGFDSGFTVTAEAFDSAAMSLGSVSLVVGPTLATLSVPFVGIKTLIIDFDAPQGSLVIDDIDFPATPIPTCGAGPIAGCRTPAAAGKASLLIEDKTPDDKDRLIWRWSKGSVTAKADFGTPLTTTNYQLCIYNGVPSLMLDATIPAGGMCNVASPKPCWQETPTGFRFDDKDATPGGITALRLKEGLGAGNAYITLKGKGALLDDPMPGSPAFAASPITVQLSNGATCWEAVYSSPYIKNVTGVSGLFKDKAD